ncbi:hypothetical protein DWX28_11880 [Blautia sp. AF19-10LB]|nr:hypothetical protein DWX28_11880 [Blautia sp. AF19-10LB]
MASLLIIAIPVAVFSSATVSVSVVSSAGCSAGASVGSSAGSSAGASVGCSGSVGASVGSAGASVGCSSAAELSVSSEDPKSPVSSPAVSDAASAAIAVTGTPPVASAPARIIAYNCLRLNLNPPMCLHFTVEIPIKSLSGCTKYVTSLICCSSNKVCINKLSFIIHTHIQNVKSTMHISGHYRSTFFYFYGRIWPFP